MPAPQRGRRGAGFLVCRAVLAFFALVLRVDARVDMGIRPSTPPLSNLPRRNRPECVLAAVCPPREDWGVPTGKDESMDIAIPLYEDFTALDAVGPYEVLSRL